MNKIIQLDQLLINKIAAGEVVERPLSVVKELTENAIDAGASQITVEIKDGGISLVRVSDNGRGILAGDLPLAFARHATSKISNFDDLMSVRTLGFRGEALSSIAAVSQVELITKPRGEVLGNRVEVHEGEVVFSGEIGCADGTTIVVGNLFYNTPARRKFLKAPSSEAGLISHCLERLALGNPSLSIKYINNGKIVFQTSGGGDLKAALLNIYGRETATKTIEIDAAAMLDEGEMVLSGLICKPEITRGNRKHGSFFINTRYVQSGLITRAIEAAMRTMLPGGRFPVYALNLALPPLAVDVNVHPNKMDVRFADEEAVFEFIEASLREALEESNLVPEVRLRAARAMDAALQKIEQIPLASNFVLEPLVPPDLSPPPPRQTPFVVKEIDPPLPKGIAGQARNDEDENETRQNLFSFYTIHGLLFHTYWLVSQDNSLYLIDQHAAHERVMYERLLNKTDGEKLQSQALLSPVALHLTPREIQILKDNLQIFADFGFEIDMGAEQPQITAVPLMMRGAASEGFFTDLLDKMEQPGFNKSNAHSHKTEILAMAACKSAVKGGDKLSEAEAHALIKQLLSLNNPFTCPHGRPTIIEISKNEIERRFMR